MLGPLPVLSTGLLTFGNLGAVVCRMTKPPVVDIAASSREVEYNYARTEQELSTAPTDYKSPYPPNTDVVTRGLREDRPELKLAASWQDLTYPYRDRDCLSFDKVTVSIRMAPRIFIAREVAAGICRDTILAHEQHHVDIDRAILAEYTPQIEAAITKQVNDAGILGPIPHEAVPQASRHMMAQLEATLDTWQVRMFTDLDRRQQAFDSRQEYDRVGGICNAAGAAPAAQTP